MAQSPNGGSISTASQTVTSTQVPATIYASEANFDYSGSLSLDYQWEISDDSINFEECDSITLDSLKFTDPLEGTSFFRRKAIFILDTGDTLIAYTNTIKITERLLFDPGEIISGNQRISTNTKPGSITGTYAISNCGSFQYSWEASNDGYNFYTLPNPGIDRPGASFNKDYNLDTLTNSILVRRKTKCGQDSGYTNTILITVYDTAQQFTNYDSTNFIDSAFIKSINDVRDFFQIPKDSGFNEFHSPENVVNSYEDSTVTSLEQRLSAINNGWTTASAINWDSMPIADSISIMADSVWISMHDSIPVYYPNEFDSLLNMYLNNNDLVRADSLLNSLPPITYEDILALQDSTSQSTTGTGHTNLAARPATPSTPNLLFLTPKPSVVINGIASPTSCSTLYCSDAGCEHRCSSYTYIANFTYPNGTDFTKIEWTVQGGEIIFKNTNPANGPIRAEVKWYNLYQNAFIAITDKTSNQYGVLKVFNDRTIVDNLNTALIIPSTQTVYCNQKPTQLSSGTLHLSGSILTATMKWYTCNGICNSGDYVEIPNSNTMIYQPPPLTTTRAYYKRVIFIYNINTGQQLSTAESLPVTVKLALLDPGKIVPLNTTVPWGTSPEFSALESPSGGLTLSGTTYTYTWEVSVNNEAWTIIPGNTANFPGYTIPGSISIYHSNIIKIRRKVEIAGLPSGYYTTYNSADLASPFTWAYWTGYSNIVTFNTVYQTADYENRNYIRENIVNVPGISTWEDADRLGADKRIQTTTYLDPLSRPIQVVGKATHVDENNNWYDMVQTIAYQAGGMVDKSLLPYPTTDNIGKFKTNAITAQYNYYLNNFNDQNAFAKVEYDKSPLNRITKSYAPGNGWVGNNIFVSGDAKPDQICFTNSYVTDCSSSDITYFKIDAAPGSLPYVPNYYDINSRVAVHNSSEGLNDYPANFLYKTESIDEKGFKVRSYSNRMGQTVLKEVERNTGDFLKTFYVYDDLGRLRYIIPPSVNDENDYYASISIDGGYSTYIKRLRKGYAGASCFVYEYDDLGRVIYKKSPGKEAEYIVYDTRNRPVFTQDGNQRIKSPDEWLVNMYDDLNRTVVVGIYKSDKTQQQLQADINAGITATTTTTIPGTPITDLTLTLSTQDNVYEASNSIILDNGFVTEDGADVTVAIDANATTPSQTITINNSPIPAGDINNASVFTALKYNYFDNYAYAQVKTFISGEQLAYKDGYVESRTVTKRFAGMITGTKTRVLKETGSDPPQYLTESVYYDEEGRPIQSLADNIKGGTEIVSTQYHFDGRALSNLETHNGIGTSYTNFTTLTKYKFDKIGRIVGIGKKINITTRSYNSSVNVTGSQEDDDAGYKIITSYKYNELGRRVKKVLSPNYNNGQGLETINYDYNIRGWLTGINKDYALGEYNSNQWDHYFGMYIGYENRDGKFAAAQYNGSITGVQWKSQGDNTPRKYDYEYDGAGRLTAANFKQRGISAESWNNTKVDFSSQYTYDDNGNIKHLINYGILLGDNRPRKIDDLRYIYYDARDGGSSEDIGNQLERVDDDGENSQDFGDFKDVRDKKAQTITYPTAAHPEGETFTYYSDLPDYTYDVNGNLTSDKNKRITSVIYNYLDKPELITIAPKAGEQGGGTIRYIYTATGEKMQKIVTQNPTPANGNLTVINTTTYIGSFIYTESSSSGGNNTAMTLQMILQEEGKIRIITPQGSSATPANYIGGGIPLPDNKEGVFDYFIKDNLGNVRSTITEEVNNIASTCTMEDANATIKQNEEAIFGNPANNEVTSTRADRPSEWKSGLQIPSTNDNKKCSQLFSTDGDTKIGPNTLLHVMAGDKISAYADYYFVQNNAASSQSRDNGVNDLVASMLTALSSGGTSTIIHGAASGDIESKLYDVPNAFFNNNSPDNPNDPNNTKPKAYLTYVFFDEQFNFIQQLSGFQRVLTADNGAAPLIMPETKAIKNGYVYVYLSNESGDPVYFDNFTVSQKKSQLLAEDHYYAYGLKIAPISSKSTSSSLSTKDAMAFGYQGSFSEETDDFDLNYNEFDLRTYDPQIGRWTTSDPYNEFASPYAGMGNDPVNNVDPSGGFIGGGFAISTAGRMTVKITAGSVGTISSSVASSVTSSVASSAISTFGAAFATGLAVGASSFVNKAVNLSIGNFAFNTRQADVENNSSGNSGKRPGDGIGQELNDGATLNINNKDNDGDNSRLKITWADLYKNFPKEVNKEFNKQNKFNNNTLTEMNTDDVYKMAGGELNKKHVNGDPNYKQSCALKLSIALIKLTIG